MAKAPRPASIYITGAAETPLGKVVDQSEFSMVALVVREALGEAGLKLKDVDALFTNYMGEEGSVQLGEYLGVRPRYAESSDMGGASAARRGRRRLVDGWVMILRGLTVRL